MPIENRVLAGIVHKGWCYRVWQSGENLGTNVPFVSGQNIFATFWEHPNASRYYADIFISLREGDIFQKFPPIPR